MTNNTQPPQSHRVVRLIFEYDGDRVRLVAQQAVEMATSDVEAGPVSGPGFYVDARDSSERTVARVAARGAFAGSREVFPERHDEPITRVDVANAKGAFTVTVPAPDSADHVTLVQLVSGAERSDARAGVAEALETVDLASFPLRRQQ